jgi:hypothetical protein
MHRKFLVVILSAVALGAPRLSQTVSSLPTGCAPLQPCGARENVRVLLSQPQDAKSPYPEPQTWTIRSPHRFPTGSHPPCQNQQLSAIGALCL